MSDRELDQDMYLTSRAREADRIREQQSHADDGPDYDEDQAEAYNDELVYAEHERNERDSDAYCDYREDDDAN